MYGYIMPDKLNMYFKDHILFRAFYCGNCLCTSKSYGQWARLTTNYDMTFLHVLMHSFMGVQPEFEDKACILNPIKKKPVVRRNPLLEKLVALNILMGYHNLNDDVIDGEGLHKMLPRNLLKKGYRRAKVLLPECDKIIKARYGELRKIEEQNCASIDRACHPFGSMLKECVKVIAAEKYNDTLGDFFYNLGRYIYLLDALDDLQKDFKKKAYNPLLAANPDFDNRKDYIARHRSDIEFCINASINRVIECYNNLHLTEGRNLLDNIVYLGLRRKFHELLASEKKLKQERI